MKKSITTHDYKKGIVAALIAAVCFGASTPVCKKLLINLSPWLFTGLLYLGSGLGLLLIFIFLIFFKKKLQSQKNIDLNLLTRTDTPSMLGSILFGGLFGPLLLIYGINQTPAATSSLLLNFEGVFTALIAALFFKEIVSRWVSFGIAFIFTGSLLLNWQGAPHLSAMTGPLLIIGACLSWALDNNITRKISHRNPLQIAMIKSLVAGGVNTFLALHLGAIMINGATFVMISLVGFIGYGGSLLCLVWAFRHLGAAKAGAYFSIAPFVGAFLSVLINPTEFSSKLLMASVLMACGIGLIASDQIKSV